MSKAYWLGKLRFLIIVAGLIGLTLGIRAVVTYVRSRQLVRDDVKSDSAHAERRNESLQLLNGDGLTQLLENESLSFAVDFVTGNVEVTNRRTGYVWRSCPTPAEMENDNANGLWKAQIQSPVIVEYIKTLTDSLSTYANVTTDGYKVDVYGLPEENGIRVDYQFPEQGIAVALDYYLRDDSLEVDLPNYMVREVLPTYTTETGTLEIDFTIPAAMVYRIHVLPYLGAGQNDDPGFLMVPDGPGGLIHFDPNRDYFTTFTAAIYGNDYAYYSYIDSSMSLQKFYSRAYFPAFGINRGDNSLLSVIHAGESNAVVTATPAGVRTSFNNVSAFFQYRTRYIKFYNLAGEGTLQFTEGSSNFSRNIRYYFLDGEDSSYSGMGNAYRKYQMNEKQFTRNEPESENLPFELSLYGGDYEDEIIFADYIPMTTFEQAKDIIGYFNDNGISNMNVVFDAWYKFGNMLKFPDRFPPASELGGERGLKSLIDYTHGLGYKFYLTDWNMETASQKGITKSTDVIYDIQDTPLNWGTFFEPYYLLNPYGVKKQLDRSMAYYKDWGIDGIEEFDADMLVSSQKSNAPVHREQAKNDMNGVYKYMKDELGDVRLWRGMTYALVDNATVVDPAARYSFSPLIDEYVPIYYMGLRGLMDFVTIPVNTMNDITYNTLKAAEFGHNLSYELTWQPTDDLFYAWNSWFLSSTQHDYFRDEYIELYNRYNSVFADLQGKFIVKHEQLEENIFRTTYENGKRIICNYRDIMYAYEGMLIPAMSFGVEVEGKVTVP